MSRFDDKVAKSLDKFRVTGRYEYDVLLTPNKKEELSNRFTRSMLVNSVWYSGNDLDLQELYQRDLPSIKIGKNTSDELNYFWAQSTEGLNIRKIHSGLPQLISEKMVDLVNSNGYETSLYLDDNEIERDEENEKRLFEILKENKFEHLMNEGIETESWGGGFAFKLSTNPAFKYPIIEVIQPEEYEATIKAGRIIEDIFITYYQKGDLVYKLKEYYGVDDKGGYIRYKLWKQSNDLWIDVPLTEIEETRELKDIEFRGIYEKFSLYKPNKLPNSEFRNSRLGESDYSGSHGLFDALDEVLSTMVQEFRDGKIRNFWPSNLLPIDPTTQKQYMPKALKKDFIAFEGGRGEREQPTKLEQTQGDIHSDKYLLTFKKLLEQILNNAGTSPQSFGISGLESTAASEESQELREKTSIRTGNKKKALWKPALEKLFKLALMLDDIKNNKPIGDYYVNVVFNDYRIETLKEKTDIANAGVLGSTWDLKTAIDYVHDEMTEEERVMTRVNIKIEKGINVFTKEEEEVYKKHVMEVQEEMT